MPINGRVRSLASGLRGYSQQLQFLLSAGALTDEIIAATGEELVVKNLILVDFARAIIAVGPPDSQSVAAVIKIARNRDAARSMDHHRRALLELRADPRVADLLSILPEEIAWGCVGDQTFVVERALPGIDARRLLEDAVRCSRMLAAAMETVAVLHQRTARTVTVDRTMTRGWIDEPLRKIRALRASYPRIALYDEAMDELGESLTNDLIGRHMAICWLHGDFFPGNILVSPDGDTVTGLVDWDLAAPDELPVLDTMQMLIGIHLLQSRSELGPAVRMLLAEDGFTAGEVDTLMVAQKKLGGESVTVREAVLLTWLRHISCNLSKSAHYSRHRWWIKSNVEAVLQSLQPELVAS